VQHNRGGGGFSLLDTEEKSRGSQCDLPLLCRCGSGNRCQANEHAGRTLDVVFIMPPCAGQSRQGVVNESFIR
jgi:hypothetical protein